MSATYGEGSQLDTFNRTLALTTRCHWQGSECPMSFGRDKDGTLYSEVQCIMGNGHMDASYRQTDTYENTTFTQLHWWMVTVY